MWMNKVKTDNEKVYVYECVCSICMSEFTLQKKCKTTKKYFEGKKCMKMYFNLAPYSKF